MDDPTRGSRAALSAPASTRPTGAATGAVVVVVAAVVHGAAR